MRKTSVCTNGHSWDKIVAFVAVTEKAMDANSLAKELRQRLVDYPTSIGIEISHALEYHDKKRLVVTYPPQTIKGICLTEQIILKSLEKIENDILEAKYQRYLLTILL